MEQRKPVALWKGIVGTAASGIILLFVVPLLILYSFHTDRIPLWAFIILFVIIGLCLISLIISLVNLIGTVKYKKRIRAEKRADDSQKSNKADDNTELLHKLLAEGKITIEEYDKLKK